MNYLVNIIFDPEYQGYVADVPALPGCMSQGKTVEKAMSNVREAIQAYRKATADTAPSKPPLNVLIAQVEV